MQFCVVRILYGDGNFYKMGVYIMDMAIIDGALKLFMLAGVIRLIK